MNALSLFNINSLLNISLPNRGLGLWQYNVYLFVHIFALLLTIALMMLSLKRKSSKAQTAVVMFELGAAFYNIGFIEEILSDTAEGGFIACITQYSGEFLVFISVVFFVSQLCFIQVPVKAYIVLTTFSLFALYSLMTTRENKTFYKSIGLNTDGLFSRPEIKHGVMFFVVIAFIFGISWWVIRACIKAYRTASPYQQKRLIYLGASLIMCWIPYMLTVSGLTGGYEVPALGICLAGVCLYQCFIQYGFFDSQILGGANALEHAKEGILIVDSNYRVRYQNKRVYEILGLVMEGSDVMTYPVLRDVFKGSDELFTINDKVYEFNIEPLIEGGYTIGSMLWIMDCTAHQEAIRSIKYAATHDTLTGLFNRTHFQFLVESELKENKLGTFVMFDMDNFKGVNDNYGHQCGDAVLQTLAKVFGMFGEQRMYSCRLGGDEFCIFLRNTTERHEIEKIMEKIFNYFNEEMDKAGFHNYTTLSSGAYTATPDISFKNLYNATDKYLYIAKTSGKNKFIIGDNSQSLIEHVHTS